ncbi:MAG TPA: serine hydrolase domain-containing protein, partial [Pirellulales bacterium]
MTLRSVFLRRLQLSFLLLAFAVALLSARSSGLAADSKAAKTQEATAATDMSQVIAQLEQAVRYEVAAKNLPAFSIALVEGERLVWAEGFGFQDAEKKIPATAETVYRVGSVSKLFTDIAVMQLVEQGKLDLDQPVQKVLPSFTPKNSFDVPITLRLLTSHRSGLVRESPIGHYFDPTEPTLKETVESLNRTSIVY